MRGPSTVLSIAAMISSVTSGVLLVGPWLRLSTIAFLVVLLALVFIGVSFAGASMVSLSLTCCKKSRASIFRHESQPRQICCMGTQKAVMSWKKVTCSMLFGSASPE